jgi:hypothetical protein
VHGLGLLKTGSPVTSGSHATSIRPAFLVGSPFFNVFFVSIMFAHATICGITEWKRCFEVAFMHPGQSVHAVALQIGTTHRMNIFGCYCH